MPDLGPLWLTAHLAAVTTVILFLLGMPLAWWLAHTRTRWRPAVEALTALPLVLPPTVLGFYLLVMLSPSTPLGAFWVQATGSTLTFSFTGLVLASVVYSLPFMVQPLQHAFEALGRAPLEAAASLRASPLDAFFRVVVLMVGGNIPGETRVVSIAIYQHVETLRYDESHALAAVLLGFTFAVLLVVYGVNRRYPLRVG